MWCIVANLLVQTLFQVNAEKFLWGVVYVCLPLIASRLIKGMVQLALFLVTEDSDLRGPPQCNVEKVESGAKE